jgi:hypothetical protein
MDLGPPLNRNREEACEEEHEEKSCAYFAGLPTISNLGFASVGQVNCFQQKRSPLAHGLPGVGSNLSGFNTSEHFFPCKKAFFSFDSERKKGPQVMMIKGVSKYTTKTPHVFIHSPRGLETSSIV